MMDVIEHARAWARRNSKKRLAELAGLHRNTLNSLYRDSWSPRFDTLKKLEAVLAAETGECDRPPEGDESTFACHVQIQNPQTESLT